MSENLARLGRFIPGPRAAKWLADAGITAAWVYEIPLNTRFRGITARDGLILQGAGGLAEAAPFWNYEPAVARRWFEGALAVARDGLPVAPAPVPLNVTVPIVSPEVASRIVRESGCRTAKVKVADPRADLDADVARLRAVRAALDEVWGAGNLVGDKVPGSGISVGSREFMRCQSGQVPHELGANSLAISGKQPEDRTVSRVAAGQPGGMVAFGQAPHELGTNSLATAGDAADGTDISDIGKSSIPGGGGFGVAPHEGETNATNATDATDASGGKIRVDVNAAWSLEQARRNLPRLVEAAGGLEYAEQPCRDLADLATLQAQGIAPIAADESIRLAPDPAQAIRDVTEAGLAAMVLKAMPLAGSAAVLRALGLAGKSRESREPSWTASESSNPQYLGNTPRSANVPNTGAGVSARTIASRCTAGEIPNGLPNGSGVTPTRRSSELPGNAGHPLVVVSSALDSGVGLLAGMSLATALGVRAGCGLGTGRLMSGGILVEEPRVEDGMLIPPVNPQLNLDLPAPASALAARWRERLELIAALEPVDI